MTNEKRFRFFLVLLTIHTTLLIASNAAGSKMIALPFGLAASATVLSYMLSFVILDSIAELYGKEYSRFVINIGLAAVALSVLFFELSIFLPAAGFWQHQNEFETVLGSSWRILLGGWTAYFVAQHLDVWTFFKIKQTAVGGRYLSVRAWGSMAVGQILDTVIFIGIAFAGEFPLLPAIVGQYLIKLIIATAATPLVSLTVRLGRALGAGDKQHS